MITLPSVIRILSVPDTSDCVRYAEEELIRWLEKAGVSAVPGGSDMSGFCLALDDAAPGLPGGSFRRTASQNRILLEASEGCGVIYGCYDLLEDLGFRFLTSDCVTVPSVLCPLEEGVLEEVPAFRGREVFWRDAMDGAFAVRLRLNSARSTITPGQGGRLMFYNFSHSFDSLVPVSRWFDSHPEYFSMRGGIRIREKTQLCLSNPEVLALCISGVRRWIRENPDCRIFSVSMNDWYNPCECPSCRAVDEAEGSSAGSVIRFVNAVADDIAADYPDVMLHTFAYLYCRKPPKITRPRKNVIVRLCSIECCYSHPIDECGRERGGIDVQNGSAANFSESSPSADSFPDDLRGWSEICDNLFIWDYTTNYANYLLPFPNLNVLQPNLRFFRSMGVSGVLEQGNFSHGKCSALGQLKTYMLGKLLWDPDQDSDALIRDFAEGYYGPASGPMVRYIRLWRNAAGPCHAGIYDMPDADYLTDSLLREARGLLEEALALSEGAPFRERVEREALSVRYAELTREDPVAPDHSRAVDDFMDDAHRLGITELFERKDFEASAEVLKTQRYVRDRSRVPSVSYPI